MRVCDAAVDFNREFVSIGIHALGNCFWAPSVEVRHLREVANTVACYRPGL